MAFFKNSGEDRPKQGLYVPVQNNNVTKAWKKLKRRLQDEGITQELRDRRYYEKPAEKRQKQIAMARKRWLKKKEQLDELYGFTTKKNNGRK
jgi:small subunit ribosomal protein S21